MQKKRLNREEREIFRVIKTIKHGYALKDFLKAKKRVKKQIRNKKGKLK